MNSIDVGSLSHARRRAVVCSHERGRNGVAQNKRTFSCQFFTDWDTTELEEDTSGGNPSGAYRQPQMKKRQKTHLVAQNSNEPLPLPIRVSLP